MNPSNRHDHSERHELTPLGSAPLTAADPNGPPGPDVPTRVRLAPWGEVESTRGRFIVDEEAFALVDEAFRRHGTDLPIDYEHQTLGGTYASPNGQAPAAGWVQRLEAQPGVGLFAHVEWTKDARAQLAARQYRYLSPVAMVRQSDRKLVGLHSVALTNKPAIAGMDPIVNADALGDTLVSLRRRLDLEHDSDVATVLLAAGARLETHERERGLADADRRVDAAVRAGKVTEGQRDFAVRLVLRDPDLFDEWLRTAPIVVPLGQTTSPHSVGGYASRHGHAARAAAEFRAHPELAALTSESAYVADALRDDDQGPVTN